MCNNGVLKISIPKGSIKRGGRSPPCGFPCLISIPKGSIKSCRWRPQPRQSTISIPKGSIKRGLLVVNTAVAHEFQFQKVRLKEGTQPRLSWPYRFQFQKVRLKVDDEGRQHVAAIEFQFQKVRLKDPKFCIF